MRRGEGVQVEFKRQCPKLLRLAKTFSAFSNSSGGTVFFGVDDDGACVGLGHVKGTKELVDQVSQFYCEPPIEIVTHTWEPLKGIDILVVEVPEAGVKPVYAIDANHKSDTWPYFRSDRENLPLDRKSLKTMSRVLSKPVDEEIDKLDKVERKILDSLDAHPRQSLGQLAKSLNISNHRAKKILVNLERMGWVHGYLNEKRREYSLAVVWRRR